MQSKTFILELLTEAINALKKKYLDNASARIKKCRSWSALLKHFQRVFIEKDFKNIKWGFNRNNLRETKKNATLFYTKIRTLIFFKTYLIGKRKEMKHFKCERKLLLLYDFLKMFPFARRGDWTRATRDRHMMIYTNIKFIEHLIRRTYNEHTERKTQTTTNSL